MRRFETPYIADWFAVSMRWVALTGILVSLLLRGQANTTTLIAPMLMILWNSLTSILASLSVRTRYHRQIALTIDFLLAAAFFWQQGGLTNASTWAALYPILTGTIYFEVWGAAIAGSGYALWQVFVLRNAFAENTMRSLSELALTLLFALVSALGGRLLMRRTRNARRAQLDAEERRRAMESERLHAIYELTSTLTATLSYKRVLDSALDLGNAALNPSTNLDTPQLDERLVNAIYLFEGNELQVGSARRYTNADMRVRLHGNEGLIKKLLDEGEPLLSADVGYDPELGRIIAFRSCTSAYGFPLRSGFNLYGIMLFAHPEPTYFTTERCKVLDIIGRQAVIAIQNARLYQDLVEEKERIVEAQEEARKKLARDLHDGPTQSVAAIAMRLNITRRMIAKDVGAATAELIKVEELAHRTTKEIRHMLFTLRPLILESQGLTAALTAMAEKIRETFEQDTIVNVDESVLEHIEMGKQSVIFAIVEEAVNNARKHARAEHIWTRLKMFEPEIALLEIEDNGVGFDVAAMNQSYDERGSLGMVNLRERAELINGLLHIDSTLGKGTRIQIYIPLTEEAADRLHHAKK